MIHVCAVVGARPNFMKMAPIIEAMNRYPDRIKHLLTCTEGTNVMVGNDPTKVLEAPNVILHARR